MVTTENSLAKHSAGSAKRRRGDQAGRPHSFASRTLPNERTLIAHPPPALEFPDQVKLIGLEIVILVVAGDGAGNRIDGKCGGLDALGEQRRSIQG